MGGQVTQLGVGLLHISGDGIVTSINMIKFSLKKHSDAVKMSRDSITTRIKMLTKTVAVSINVSAKVIEGNSEVQCCGARWSS